ncbi:MAG: VWA domain-containing protein [Hyphomicrobiaceae bacterium]
MWVGLLRRRDACAPPLAHAISRALRLAVQGFCSDQRGAVSVLFGIMFILLLMFAAIAIDHSRFTSEAIQNQHALDAALLAASDALGQENQDQLALARARAFYKANRPDGAELDVDKVVIHPEDGSLEGSSKFDWKTTLLQAFGWDKVRIGTAARVARGGTAEIALVLDNSGSMSGSYIEDLKAASTNLINTVFYGVDGEGKVALSIVPFAGSVNVGPAYRGSSWIDNDGSSSVSRENADVPRSRFQLFDDLGVSWAGCVEMRPAPYDASDVPPDPGNPDTLFVPMFAPDEPDDVNSGGSNYSNNYISDDGGTCPKMECTCQRWRSPGKCASNGWVLAELQPAAAQARTCKYSGAQVGYGMTTDKCKRGSYDGAGPNAFCTTVPLLPLSITKAEALTAIASMKASGMTNIGEGLAWGWRTLSPGAPFTAGRAYDDGENKKIIILMTDGQNTYTHSSNHNGSAHGAAGYAKPFAHPDSGRLGTSYSSSSYSAKLTERTRAVCAGAKSAGIKIYTIAFRLENDAATQALLQECASDSKSAFAASNGAILIETFQNIAREIANLRLTN